MKTPLSGRALTRRAIGPKLAFLAAALVLLGLSLTACTAVPSAQAEKIAYAGHGLLFDKEMNEIKLDVPLVTEIQDSMIAALVKANLVGIPDDTAAALKEAQGLLTSQELTDSQRIVIKGRMIGKLLEYAPEDLKAKYDWRNAALLSNYLSGRGEVITPLRPGILDPAPAQASFALMNAGDTDYMAQCRARGVPIPPDWAESGTPWVFQGTLTQNMLVPGEFAAVWTYSDPSRRGACIALPRKKGNTPSNAGIICQSATGNACFWDNKRRDDPNEKVFDWSGGLVISELRDGSNLSENCTLCHRGNDVFLMTPDDPTWAKLLRGPLSDPALGTFTTQVESSSDNQGGHPRYIPITTQPPRKNWDNALPSGIACASCHEAPPSNIQDMARRIFVSMPPSCALPSSADPSACYGPAHIGSLRVSISPRANADGWSNADTRVILEQIRPAIGLQSITFEAQGAQPISQTTIAASATNFTVSQSGQTKIRYFATLTTGRPPGLWGTMVVNLDKLPPVTTANAQAGNAPGEHIVTLTATDQPGGSGVKLVDFQASQPPAAVERIDAATLRVTIKAPGITTLHYWSADIAGNFEGPHNLIFAPVVDVQPTSLAFKSPVGVPSQPQSVTLKNIGQTILTLGQINTDTYDFLVRSNAAKPCGATLAPGAECLVDVIFGPSAAKTYSGVLTIANNSASNPITVPLVGTIVAPAVEFTPQLLVFPDTQVRDTSQPMAVTVRNSGEAPLVITEVSTPADFEIQQDGCTPWPKTLQPNDTCDIQVAFRPRVGGASTGALMLSDNTPTAQDLLPLKGVGLAVPIPQFGPTSLDFGSQPVGTTGAPLTLALTNVGVVPLEISSIGLGGVDPGDFTVTGGACQPTPGKPVVLLPELTCDLTLQFNPTVPGNRSAEILFSTNVPNQPQQTVPLLGVGTATPIVSVSPTSLVFPDWPVNQSSPAQFVTLTNHSSTPLGLRQVQLSGTHPDEFEVPAASDACSGAQIAAGGTCSVGVTFAPRAIGARNAQLVFADSSGNQHVVSLTGTGVGPRISFDPATLTFEALPVGAFSQRQQVFVNNTGNAPLVISAVSVTGDFVHATWCNYVVPGGFCVVTVVFRPSAVGTRSGQIVVTSNAEGSPHTVELTGAGLAASMSLDPTALTFGSQQVGTTSASQVIKLKSSGPAALSIASIVAGGDFQVVGHTCDIKPEYQPVGTSCMIEVVFKPSQTGVTSGVLTVTSDALDSPHVVALSGSGN